ncbi:DNA methyltransferase, partial [Desulfococcaceae bacterium HSG8]|nr:DNA methyltransferase [Desulfococcaceae bacterium HSG8]
TMLQIEIPFNPPKPVMKNLSYRKRLSNLLKGDLDFHGQKNRTPVHTWHAFPARFPPQLPKAFITELTQPGDIVYDPMMGSCTTLLEAVLSGRHAVGTDIDPLSVRLAQAKLNAADITNAEISGHELIEKANRKLTKEKKAVEKDLESRFDPKTKTFIDYWFAQNTQLELAALISEIENIGDSALRAFFTLVFSAIIITKSGGVSLAYDLAHTRPHRVADKIPDSPVIQFGKRLRRNLKLMTCYPQADSLIIKADSQQLPLAKDSIHLIVTSPPYASNAIDYMRAHKFSLVWLGYPISSLTEIRRTYIGGETISGKELLLLPEHSEHIVSHLSESDQKKGKVLHRYYSEMSRSLSEMYRVLKPGCAAILVVGTSVIRGSDIEIQACLKEIAECQGFDHIHIGIRKLDRNKRMMPARRNSKNKTGIEARMHEEYVMGFLKPGK